MATHQHHAPGSDKAPAFIGLIGGAIVLGAFMYGIVLWTNAKFAGHGAAAGGTTPAAATAPAAGH